MAEIEQVVQTFRIGERSRLFKDGMLIRLPTSPKFPP